MPSSFDLFSHHLCIYTCNYQCSFNIPCFVCCCTGYGKHAAQSIKNGKNNIIIQIAAKVGFISVRLSILLLNSSIKYFISFCLFTLSNLWHVRTSCVFLFFLSPSSFLPLCFSRFSFTLF